MSALRMPDWSALTRLVVALVVGALTYLVTDLGASTPLSLLGGITAMGVVFDGTALLALWPMSAAETKTNARREALNPIVEEVVVVAASLLSIVGIAALIVLGESGTRAVAATIGLAGVFATWAMLHLMYAARYADLFYDEPAGGIVFSGGGTPSYRDFLYYSFTIGMTYAVSDSSAGSTEVRSLTLRHGLLSYLFGTVILAATINLVGSIVIP